MKQCEKRSSVYTLRVDPGKKPLSGVCTAQAAHTDPSCNQATSTPNTNNARQQPCNKYLKHTVCQVAAHWDCAKHLKHTLCQTAVHCLAYDAHKVSCSNAQTHCGRSRTFCDPSRRPGSLQIAAQVSIINSMHVGRLRVNPQLCQTSGALAPFSLAAPVLTCL